MRARPPVTAEFVAVLTELRDEMSIALVIGRMHPKTFDYPAVIDLWIARAHAAIAKADGVAVPADEGTP